MVAFSTLLHNSCIMFAEWRRLPVQSHRIAQKGWKMLKFVTVNPIVAMLAAIVATAETMVQTVYVQVAPVATRIVALFARPPPSSTNRFMFAAQRGASMTGYVIGIAVAALVVSIIVPIAFGQFFATVTTSWDAPTILIWGVIPLVVILAIVLFFLNQADKQS